MSDLTDLGLSSYEDRAYRALLALGSAAASEVASRADVPTGRIYDVVNGLAARNIVETRPGTDPTVYVPVDPDEAVDRLLDERRRELERRETAYREVADRVRSELAPGPPVDARFWPTTLGGEDAVALWREQAQTATERVRLVVGPPYDAADWETYASEVAPVDRIDGAVDVQVLLAETVLSSVPSDELATIRDVASDVSVRVASGLRLTFDVVDDVEASIDVANPFEPADRLGVVVSRDESLVSTLATAFDRCWGRAEPV
ncbi:transcriptional regulator TrmB [Halovivax asiaticus JCM 14624]|uniref:Transcriptional regulator TrmB n=1 Tax=Halovivax asiaticus JCM 14624 TaxID=1227490 RepID=M0BPM1_9EURY|nr:helix-turn-helix domain-containing protein [Halovivax asiaticus]ELZ12263.1 transcriptional regulator TrmB [Halovivax asiaticus JCM 14624]